MVSTLTKLSSLTRILLETVSNHNDEAEESHEGIISHHSLLSTHSHDSYGLQVEWAAFQDHDKHLIIPGLFEARSATGGMASKPLEYLLQIDFTSIP